MEETSRSRRSFRRSGTRREFDHCLVADPQANAVLSPIDHG
jgi:hypothetical protein